MGVNKVMAKGEVILDLTQDTVTPNVLADGYTAHNAAGDPIVGVGGAVVAAIDDTAGIGDDDVVWSADRSMKEIKNFDRLINFKKHYFDYGYDVPCNIAADPSAQYSGKIGAVRNGPYVIVTGNNNSGYGIAVKLSGEVTRTINYDSFTTGITFAEGKRYRAVVQKVSGSCLYNGEEELLSARIYKAGTTTEIGRKIKDHENARFITEFVADDSEYNLVLYVPNNRNVTNYSAFVYIEEAHAESLVNEKASEEDVIKESATVTEIANAYISEDGTASNSSYYKLCAVQVSPDEIYQVMSYLIPNANRRCQWVIVNQTITAENYLSYTKTNVVRKSMSQSVMDGEGGYVTSDYFSVPTGGVTLLICGQTGSTRKVTADKITYMSTTDLYNLKKSAPVAKIGYSNITWEHKNSNCDLLITGTITLYLNGTTYTLTAEQLYALADESSVVNLRSNNSIRSYDFALVFDTYDKDFKFLAFTNSKTSSGRYILLFGHYYTSMDAVGLLVDYCLERRVYNIESTTEETSIADYFVNEAKASVSSIYEVADEPCYSICFVTDSHHNNSPASDENDDIWFDTIKNITYINHLYPFDAIIHGGDLITGGIAKATAQRLISEMRQGMIVANPNTFILTGNHDDNSYNTYDAARYLDESARFAIMQKNTSAKVYHDGHESFYYDVDTLGIRVICICALCGIGSESSSNVWGYTDNLLSWFRDVALNTENQVVIFSHMAFTNAYMTDAPAPKNGTSMQNAVNNFIQNGGTVIGLIFGHVHYDILGKPTGSEFYQMGTSCSLCKENSKTPPEGGSVPSREFGTVTADCWDCIIIKPRSRKVNVIRFGAGIDREFVY